MPILAAAAQANARWGRVFDVAANAAFEWQDRRDRQKFAEARTDFEIAVRQEEDNYLARTDLHVTDPATEKDGFESALPNWDNRAKTITTQVGRGLNYGVRNQFDTWARARSEELRGQFERSLIQKETQYRYGEVQRRIAEIGTEAERDPVHAAEMMKNEFAASLPYVPESLRNNLMDFGHEHLVRGMIRKDPKFALEFLQREKNLFIDPDSHGRMVSYAKQALNEEKRAEQEAVDIMDMQTTLRAYKTRDGRAVPEEQLTLMELDDLFKARKISETNYKANYDVLTGKHQPDPEKTFAAYDTVSTIARGLEAGDPRYSPADLKNAVRENRLYLDPEDAQRFIDLAHSTPNKVLGGYKQEAVKMFDDQAGVNTRGWSIDFGNSKRTVAARGQFTRNLDEWTRTTFTGNVPLNRDQFMIQALAIYDAVKKERKSGPMPAEIEAGTEVTEPVKELSAEPPVRKKSWWKRMTSVRTDAETAALSATGPLPGTESFWDGLTEEQKTKLRHLRPPQLAEFVRGYTAPAEVTK